QVGVVSQLGRQAPDLLLRRRRLDATLDLAQVRRLDADTLGQAPHREIRIGFSTRLATGPQVGPEGPGRSGRSPRGRRGERRRRRRRRGRFPRTCPLAHSSHCVVNTTHYTIVVKSWTTSACIGWLLAV